MSTTHIEPSQEIPIRRSAAVRPLLREEYDRLVDMGAFKDEKVELLDGTIYYMSPQGEPHAWAVTLLGETLVTALKGRARVRVQMPITASETSAPEPDLALVRPDRSV